LLYHQSVAAECAQSDRDNKLAKGTTYSLLCKLLPTISPEVHPRDLSEGQRLALALSIVLASNPQALILDEPTRGLDYQAKAVLINILKSYSQELEKPIILATHDVELVAEVADRVLFLADGEVVADGPVLDILLSSPAFAPQIAKVMSPKPWLTVSDVMNAVSSQ
jgi:energy-coupling factor transport system ATP-binding protein